MPEPITSDIAEINKLLMEHFGRDTDSEAPMWRVVFSDDQYEHRLTNFTDEGFQLLQPEVRLLPKYKQWIQHAWVLEHLVIVPIVSATELPGSAKSYEPIWPFLDPKTNEPIPPSFWACKFVVDTVNAATGKKSMVKYVDEEAKNPIEQQEKRISQLTNELFGDESMLMGRTITGEAVGYTTSEEKK